MKFDLIIEQIIKDFSKLKGSAFWLTPEGKVIDVFEYESHGIGALVVLKGYDPEDAGFDEGEHYADELRHNGYISGYVEDTCIYFTYTTIEPIKKLKFQLLNFMITHKINDISLSVERKDGTFKDYNKDYNWLKML